MSDHKQQQQPDSQSKSALGYLWAAREYITPTLKKSAFLDKGLLTPEEFVKAGDELTFRCPTWEWASGDPSRLKSYLPSNKQYLVTRNVPCTARVAMMEAQLGGYGRSNNNNEDDVIDDDGEWLVSNVLRTQDMILQMHQQQNQADDEAGGGDIEDEFDIIDDEGEIVAKEKVNPIVLEQQKVETAIKSNNNANDDEYADMDDYYEDNNVLVDADAAAVVVSGGQNMPNAISSSSASSYSSSNVLKVRTYDLSITYDNYYHTPRIWMSGKDTSGQYLSGKQMMEDVMSDYANRTVTVEQHPHVSGPFCSIHPCKHGAVMKTIVRNLVHKDTANSSKGDSTSDTPPPSPTISVEMYLFIFLKFVSSIIPTINYDFTIDVAADTSK